MKIEKTAYNIHYMTTISFSFYENNVKTYETNSLLLPEELKAEINHFKQSIVENHKDSKTLRVQDKNGLTFLCLFANERNIIIGPFLINDDFEHFIDNLIINHRFINEEAIMVEQFYYNAKILTESHQTILVRMLQNSEFFEFDKVRIFNVQIKKVDNNGSVKENAENDINAKFVEANNQIQEKLLTIVRNGDVEAARLLDFAKTANQLLIYRNNPFTNIKTSLMIFDALCNREALKSGVDLFLANKISNNIKFNINKISMSSEARTMAEKIISTYAKVVRDYTLMNHSSNIKKIILYIRKNLTNKISLDDIAGDLFITKEHLSRLFKKEMGLTISEYIINAKIEEAKTLLKETDYNVLDIAVLLNFANSSHFSNSFKKITGMAPSDYRKTL